MTIKTLRALTVTALISLFSFASASQFESQIEARQASMKMLGYYVGILGGMARGKIPYDADQATSAASNLALLAQMNNGTMWPAGSDMDSHEGTVAKAALWANFADAGKFLGDLKDASMALEGVAGDGQEALGKAMGAVGKTCSGCHKQFRAKK